MEKCRDYERVAIIDGRRRPIRYDANVVGRNVLRLERKSNGRRTTNLGRQYYYSSGVRLVVLSSTVFVETSNEQFSGQLFRRNAVEGSYGAGRDTSYRSFDDEAYSSVSDSPHGSPLFSSILRFLGETVEGQDLYYGTRMYDFPYITFADKTIVDFSMVAGHYKDYKNWTLQGFRPPAFVCLC
jgi:hypothetical protein